MLTASSGERQGSSAPGLLAATRIATSGSEAQPQTIPHVGPRSFWDAFLSRQQFEPVCSPYLRASVQQQGNPSSSLTHRPQGTMWSMTLNTAAEGRINARLMAGKCSMGGLKLQPMDPDFLTGFAWWKALLQPAQILKKPLPLVVCLAVKSVKRGLEPPDGLRVQDL